MSMRINIENILQSPKEIFLEIIKKLTSSNIYNAKKELKIDNTQIDTILLDAIELVLYHLNSEEGYVGRLLYSIFGFELRKNKRREQLSILGSQLKFQYNIVQKDIYRVELTINNITSSIKNLLRLQEAFQSKLMFIVEEAKIEKSKLYIDILGEKIEELKKYKMILKDRLKKLEKKEKKYRNLSKRIPRYKEITEEKYLQLTMNNSKKTRQKSL
jgi:hypothetical protein